MFISKLRKTNPRAYRYFRKAIGYKGGAVARCQVAKHSACRGAHCSVKKTVKCHSVCPIKKISTGTITKCGNNHGAWTLPENTP